MSKASLVGIEIVHDGLLGRHQRLQFRCFCIHCRTQNSSGPAKRIEVGIQLQQRLARNDTAEHLPCAFQRVIDPSVFHLKQRQIIAHHRAALIGNAHQVIGILFMGIEGGSELRH